jgi:hypothetical protein
MIDKREGKHTFLIQRAAPLWSKRSVDRVATLATASK